MPRVSSCICDAGDIHLAEVDFFDEQVGVLERRLERRAERVEVLGQQMHRADQVDGAGRAG